MSRALTALKRKRNPLRLRYIPPPTEKELEEYARTYAWDKSKARGQKIILKEWESRAQRIVDKLAKRDGIRPPKVEVSPNAEVWVNGKISGGMYIMHSKKIAIGSTTILVDQLGVQMRPGNRCPYPLHTLLHEYQHHRQYETLGIAKANAIYEKEGSVGHEGHTLERDANDFAEKECRRLK